MLRSHPVLSSAAALISASAATSALGAVYWWCAARLLAPSAVGAGAAGISALTLVGTLATVGIGTLLISELRRPTGRLTLLSAGLALTGAVGALFAITFIVVCVIGGLDLRLLGMATFGVPAFVLGCAATAAGLVYDQAILGVGRARLQLYRNLFFGISKLGLMLLGVVALSRSADVLVGAWAIGAASSVALIVAIPRPLPLVRRKELAALVQFAPQALAHHVFNMALLAPSFILPLVVTIELSTASNAAFYIAWMVAGLVYIVPTSVSLALYAHSANDPASLKPVLRRMLRRSLALATVAALAVAVTAPFVLAVFGPYYRQEGTVALEILAFAVIPVSVKSLFVALVRIRTSVARVAPWVVLGALSEVGLAAAGAQLDGLRGLCLGWLIALCVEAAVMLPSLLAGEEPHIR